MNSGGDRTLHVKDEPTAGFGETLIFDQATLHGTWVSPTVLAVVEYKPHLSGGTGRFANATADTSAIGELDFRTGHAVLRYSGTLCTSGNN